MDETHRERIEALLSEAAAEHAGLVSRLPPELARSLPVDAQGVTQAIDHLAAARAHSPARRQSGRAARPRVRACAAGARDGDPLGREVRSLLIAHPPPVDSDGHDVVPALRATYAAHERAVVMIAASLDAA
jgi:hypothetical protein